MYEDGVLQHVRFSEGRILISNGSNSYDYHFKDHLCYTRVMFTEDEVTGEAKIVQEAHYYPFGIQMKGVVNNTTVPSEFFNQWLHGNQDLQNEIGTDLYAYRLRTYNPTIGRWYQQDPYDEFFNPYTGIGYNSANLIDSTGGV